MQKKIEAHPRTDCSEHGIEKPTKNTKTEEKGDGKKDLGGCRPRDDLHATWRVVASKMSGGAAT